MKLRPILRGLLFIAVLGGIGLAIRHSGLADHFDEHWIDAEIRNSGVTGIAIFLAIGGLMAGVGLPRQIVSFLGGYAFGLAGGTVIALAATVIGCISAFVTARLLGRDFIAPRLPVRIRKADDYFRDNTFTMTLLIRLLPVGSNVVLNLAAGVSSVRAMQFFAGSAIGYIPQTVVFALIGSGVRVDPGIKITLSVLLFLVSAILGVWLYRRFRHGRSFNRSIDEAVGLDDIPDDSSPDEARFEK
jgi:uncharacterized membrane protein YdjX (TVP38/TMEM64 family)